MKQPPMKYSPLTGLELDSSYSCNADNWRTPIQPLPWMFNPWTGGSRHAGDRETDPQGRAIWDKSWGPMRVARDLQKDYDDAVQQRRHGDLAATLTERGNRYGLFTGHANVTQRLKTVIANELGERAKVLHPDQQEALDMICHKIGRIVNGDADYDDSWVDIAGYAKLVADRLQGVVR